VCVVNNIVYIWGNANNANENHQENFLQLLHNNIKLDNIATITSPSIHFNDRIIVDSYIWGHMF
jgi:hypothetical protein